MRRSAGSLEAKKAAETVSIVLARMGEGRGYDLELDDEDGGGMVMEGSSSLPSTNMHSANEGSDEGLGIEGQKLLQDVVGFNECEWFLLLSVEKLTVLMGLPISGQIRHACTLGHVYAAGSAISEFFI